MPKAQHPLLAERRSAAVEARWPTLQLVPAPGAAGVPAAEAAVQQQTAARVVLPAAGVSAAALVSHLPASGFAAPTSGGCWAADDGCCCDCTCGGCWQPAAVPCCCSHDDGSWCGRLQGRRVRRVARRLLRGRHELAGRHSVSTQPCRTCAPLCLPTLQNICTLPALPHSVCSHKEYTPEG